MTIKDIAKKSGYAVGTVSRVLNGHPDVSDEARERILAVVAETGFQPNGNARHLKQRGSQDIAVVVKGAGNQLFAVILEEMQSRIRAAGKAAAVFYLDEDEDEVEQAARVCRELKPLGVIFLGGDRGNFKRGFGRIQCPCVLVTTRADDLGFPNLSSVSTDDVAGAEQAMDLLLKAGHRRVGIIGGTSCIPSPEQECNTSQLRLTGCMRACAERGVPFDPIKQTIQTRYSMDCGYSGVGELLERCPDTTAVFAMCDVMAIGALRAIRDRGLRVPEDVALVGYDGIDQSAYTVPRLATVRQDVGQLARRGVEILLSQLEGAAAAVHELVPFELLAGESVRPVPAGKNEKRV